MSESTLDILVTPSGQVITESSFRCLSFETTGVGDEKDWFAIIGWDGGAAQVGLTDEDADSVRDWVVNRAFERSERTEMWLRQVRRDAGLVTVDEYIAKQKEMRDDVE